MALSVAGRAYGSTARGLKADERFPDPFMDMASTAMPDTIEDALRWCEYIMLANGTYRQAIGRVISYFITDVEVSNLGENKVGREEREKYVNFLDDTLGIKNVLHTVALDYVTYGNSFTTLLMPFRRYLSCKGCGLELPLKKVFNTPEFRFAWRNYEFQASCPHCHYSGSWRHIDRRSGEQGELKIKRWNPHEMDVLYDPYSDDAAYIWRIPDDYRQLIRQGHLHHLERVSWEVVQAIKHDQNLLFDKDVVYHMKEDPLAGIYARGWGISRVLVNFRQAWYTQILHRFNEAIALDYVVPFRCITPMPKPGSSGPESSDPVHSINMGGFVARVNQMLRARRRDPARWNVLPFGVEYKALGGDATQLAPKELLDQAIDTLLTSIGVPVEFYKGTLSVQAAPAALRLFEANWSHLVHNLNRFIAKLVGRLAEVLSWEPVSAKLVRVTHADDLNRQMAKLQLMMGQQISQTTGLKSVGLDFVEENQQKLEEERLMAEAQQETQQEMEQSRQMDDMAMPQQMMQGAGQPGASATGQPAPAGAAPQGGTPQQLPGAGMMMGAQSAVDMFIASRVNTPNIPRTPEELNTQAQIIANDLMARPESQKDSELIKLKKSDPTMHALVRSIIDDIRQQAQTQGGNMLLAQQYGKQARHIDLRESQPTARPPKPSPSRYIEL